MRFGHRAVSYTHLDVYKRQLLFTVGLTALELFVIHAVCRYCLVSAAIIVVMFLLAVSYLRAVNRNGTVDEAQPHEGRLAQ